MLYKVILVVIEEDIINEVIRVLNVFFIEEIILWIRIKLL